MTDQNRIVEVSAAVAGKPIDPSPEESLFESGLLDSFALADFVAALEQEFHSPHSGFRHDAAQVRHRRADRGLPAEPFLIWRTCAHSGATFHRGWWRTPSSRPRWGRTRRGCCGTPGSSSGASRRRTRAWRRWVSARRWIAWRRRAWRRGDRPAAGGERDGGAALPRSGDGDRRGARDGGSAGDRSADCERGLAVRHGAGRRNWRRRTATCWWWRARSCRARCGWSRSPRTRRFSSAMARARAW